jgi:proteasome assembly chaperone (PAC2) family protein
MLSVNTVKKVSSKSLLVFASLPDMGRVGELASSFLANQNGSELVATINLAEKPWVNVKDGIVASMIDVFRIYFSEEHHMLVLTGINQPEDPSELYGLCNTFLDYCQLVGPVNRLYTAGGSFNDLQTGEPRVVGVVTNVQLKELLLKTNIDIISREISAITWFNGLILGLAATRGIDGIGLYGEIPDKTIPQPLAAKSILKAFGKIEGIKIDTKPLDRQYEEVLDNLEKRKGITESGPGIG